MIAHAFQTIEKRGLACEVHLLVDSRYRMLPTDLGYCSRKARWWWEGFALCSSHRAMVESLLRERAGV